MGKLLVKRARSCSGYRWLTASGSKPSVLSPDLAPIHSERTSSQNETNSQRPGRHHCIKGARSDRGTMATIGRAAAVADLRGIHLSGLTAWLLWLFIHLMHRVGFRNRRLVFVQWMWNYCTFRRGVRLIVQPHPSGRQGLR